MPEDCCRRRELIGSGADRHCRNCGQSVPERPPLEVTPLVAAMLKETCDG